MLSLWGMKSLHWYRCHLNGNMYWTLHRTKLPTPEVVKHVPFFLFSPEDMASMFYKKNHRPQNRFTVCLCPPWALTQRNHRPFWIMFTYRFLILSYLVQFVFSEWLERFSSSIICVIYRWHSGRWHWLFEQYSHQRNQSNFSSYSSHH